MKNKLAKLSWLKEYNVSPRAIKQVIVSQSNNKKRLANTKTRDEINKTNKKAYRQKGTGNARRGQLSSPILVKGGVSMGPRFHVVSHKNNKKLCQNTRLSILNKHLNNNAIHIMNIDFEKRSTKHAVSLLKNIHIDVTKTRTMVIIDQYDEIIRDSFKNLYNVTVASVININTVDLLNAHQIVMTPKAVSYLTEKYNISACETETCQDQNACKTETCETTCKTGVKHEK